MRIISVIDLPIDKTESSLTRQEIQVCINRTLSKIKYSRLRFDEQMTKRARMEDLGLSSNKTQINYPGDAGITQRQPTKKLVIRTFKGINDYLIRV